MSFLSITEQSCQYILSIINRLEQGNVTLSNIAINIGANDGITNDIISLLYTKKSYGGLCIEYDQQAFDRLKKNIPDRVDKICIKVTPYNIFNLIKQYNNIDIISIDIDSFDYEILNSIILHQPKIIAIELNENIPPGITYYVKYGENYDYSIHGSYQLFGCSLDAVTRLGKRHNYTLLKMEWNNAILVADQYLALFDNIPVSNYDAYFTGYYHREGREKFFYWKGEEAKCAEMSTQQAMNYLESFFYKDLDKIHLSITNE
jgi:hypothetical protein